MTTLEHGLHVDALKADRRGEPGWAQWDRSEYINPCFPSPVAAESCAILLCSATLEETQKENELLPLLSTTAQIHALRPSFLSG